MAKSLGQFVEEMIQGVFTVERTGFGSRNLEDSSLEKE